MFHACDLRDIRENRARIICLSGERVAVFKYDGKISAVSNVCQHQNGPLGEGKILDGCITCPWHGWLYDVRTGQCLLPARGAAIATYAVRIEDGDIWVEVP